MTEFIAILDGRLNGDAKRKLPINHESEFPDIIEVFERGGNDFLREIWRKAKELPSKSFHYGHFSDPDDDFDLMQRYHLEGTKLITR